MSGEVKGGAGLAVGTRRVAGRSLLQPFHGVCFFTCHASSETTAVPRSTCEADSEIAADLDAKAPQPL